jgi:hypothetical protein
VLSTARHNQKDRTEQIFSCFGRIRQPDVHGKPGLLGLPELPKSIYTDRPRKLCQLLKMQRKVARLTQTVVANRLGKPPSYVAKYEGGDRRLDVLEYLEVAAAIGLQANSNPSKIIRNRHC